MELLVVILIIGILAAIAIPSFLNQQDKGHDVDAKSTAATAARALGATRDRYQRWLLRALLGRLADGHRAGPQRRGLPAVRQLDGRTPTR